MWLLLRRFLLMSITSWALAKAATRYPSLRFLQRFVGTRRYGRSLRGR